jgi:hypothetical protein
MMHEHGIDLQLAVNMVVHLNHDMIALIARLLVVFRDPMTYKMLLTCRGSSAQQILDLLQDVSVSLYEEEWVTDDD